MTDAAEHAANNGQPTVEQAAPAAALPTTASGGAAADERPELAVGAAFAGGLVLALFLKRLAR